MRSPVEKQTPRHGFRSSCCPYIESFDVKQKYSHVHPHEKKGDIISKISNPASAQKHCLHTLHNLFSLVYIPSARPDRVTTMTPRRTWYDPWWPQHDASVFFFLCVITNYNDPLYHREIMNGVRISKTTILSIIVKSWTTCVYQNHSRKKNALLFRFTFIFYFFVELHWAKWTCCFPCSVSHRYHLSTQTHTWTQRLGNVSWFPNIETKIRGCDNVSGQ